MPYRTFLLYNAVGALVWGTGATLLGYFAGASYQRVAQTVGRGSAGLLALLVLVGVVVWHRRRPGASHTGSPRVSLNGCPPRQPLCSRWAAPTGPAPPPASFAGSGLPSSG
jgi:uncharacterized protein (TIGR03382 family)